MPFVVALTGGVASGKSTVARLFAAHGIHTWDADDAARAVVALDTPGLAAIGHRFGDAVLQPDGSLNRRALRNQVFQDASARKDLEAIVHPLIDVWLREKVRADDGPWCLLAIPLLAETWPQYAWVDRVLLVDATREVRRQRLMTRDRVDADVADGMLAAQARDEQRHAIADDIINNNDDTQTLHVAVDVLHARYRKLAQQKSTGASPAPPNQVS